MKIIDRLKEDRIHISFEVFPPKTDEGIDKVLGGYSGDRKAEPGVHQRDLWRRRRDEQKYCKDRFLHKG